MLSHFTLIANPEMYFYCSFTKRKQELREVNELLPRLHIWDAVQLGCKYRLFTMKLMFYFWADRHIFMIYYIKIIKSGVYLNVGDWNFLINTSFNRFVLWVLNIKIEKHHLFKDFCAKSFVPTCKTFVLWSLRMECLGNIVLGYNRKE